MFARTVIRAFALTSIPSIATPAIKGVSITFGLTLICTASSTSRPAKSIVARAQMLTQYLLGASESTHLPRGQRYRLLNSGFLTG